MLQAAPPIKPFLQPDMQKDLFSRRKEVVYVRGRRVVSPLSSRILLLLQELAPCTSLVIAPSV
ncbi:hypothetical protein X546_00105 [Brevibacillus borstelensis cifa_chp40]|nr:hypothetical protein X546_00105 [Brevibacillus borstelensis cifa_chp40]